MQSENVQNIGLELFNKLLKAFNQTTEEVTALFDDDAVVEYPYAAALGSSSRLNKREYADHLNAILGQMPDIAFSGIRVYPVSNSDSFWAEVHGETLIPKTGKKYEQDYVMYFTVQ
ncbi:MAG: nuclear transport factor 2 family protein, partial [Acidobacteriota bacterium]|nr:nuclear transport factor 2 family protein [Acidobacteriota bacterium]